jgi:hypothetical protein
MKSLIVVLFFTIITIYGQPVIKQQAALNGNNLATFIWNTGVFNQDLRTNNTPGLEWPNGSGKFAVYTSGLTIGAYINGQLRIASASYNGEYCPGYSQNGQYFTDSRFKFYKINKGDNYNSNPDWLNWGLMVPYGAPFTDINNNGTYEYFIDIPGYKNAKQTVFICLTDGNPSIHTLSEGFGGGTTPLFAQVGVTAWCYDTLSFTNVNFLRWSIVNKSELKWDSIYFSIVSDVDLGDAQDDYLGCDSTRNMAYCYNADNIDGDGTYRTYGLNPPAVGFAFLDCGANQSDLSSANYFRQSPGGCEWEIGSAIEAYNVMSGIKKDRTPWVIPLTEPPVTVKLLYPGDPETNSGWTEYGGKVFNCGGSLYGPLYLPVNPADRKMVMSTGSKYLSLSNNQSYTLLAAQMVARGTDHKNSVTKLKQLSDSANALCQNGFVIGINQHANEIPTEFNLYQNYPNPFNPVTKIKFSIPKSEFVTIKIYDALGREITTLVNDKIIAGVYSVGWDGSAYPSGIYFLKLQTKDFTQTNKMILLK